MKKDTRKTTVQEIPPSGSAAAWSSSCVQIGNRHAQGREIRLDRTALFEKVWSEPIEKLAKALGLSGRELARACHRLKIPVPPHGYWARVQHGQQIRRPRLPAGEAEEIVINVPA